LKHISVRISGDGELLVRGATVSPGYVGNGPDSGVSHEAGYLHTGDLVQRFGRRLYFLGRKKEIIVTGEGFNVVPADVEEALSRTSGVVDSVVLAKRNHDFDEVHAVLLLRLGTEAAKAVQSANSLLMPEQRIRSWTVWPKPDFPRTSLLKVRREDVKAHIEHDGKQSIEGNPSEPTCPVNADIIAQEPDRRTRVALLARYLTEVPPEEVGENHARLAADFALSSLDFVELLAKLEQVQERKITHARLPLDSTVSSVHAALLGLDGRGSRLPLHQPTFSAWPPLVGLRMVFRRSVIAAWATFSARCSPIWRTDPEQLSSPFFFAVAPHRSWLDAFAVSAVLPERLARRVLVVTNRDFHEFFDPTPATPLLERLKVGLGYYLWLPLTYPFAIVPHYGSTREGLLDTMRWVDREYCPLVFPKGIIFGETDSARHDPGPATLALEAGVPIVPVWIRGNDNLRLGPRARIPRVRVLFGTPVRTGPDQTMEEIRYQVEAGWETLAAVEE
jgi:long-chain acyl-CoA synthetase